MKTYIKFIILVLLFFSMNSTFGAGVFEWLTPNDLTETTQSSMEVDDAGWDLGRGLIGLAVSVLSTFKYILSAVIVIYLVYAGAQMVFSFGTDDEKLSTSKRQIWYSAIGLLFINIPGTLYSVFRSDGWEINEIDMTNPDFNAESNGGSIFLNEAVFENVFYDQIVRFLQVTILWLAVFVIILAGYQIITARGRDEKISEARNKILYSVVALFLVWFVEWLKRVVYSAQIQDWVNLFSAIANLLLLFAGPVAIFFVFLAAFYYITSNGDEDKMKKAKNIVINTLLATLLVVALYTFLLDLIQI